MAQTASGGEPGPVTASAGTGGGKAPGAEETTYPEFPATAGPEVAELPPATAASGSAMQQASGVLPGQAAASRVDQQPDLAASACVHALSLELAGRRRALPGGGVARRVRDWWCGLSGWERHALPVIVAFAAVMFGWEAAHAAYHGFYAVAVRSMTTGWRAFLFGALDPNASITIDKIPGFLWPQAVSALVFGFHPWSLALPEAVEGVVAVVALHVAVRRWIGPGAGVSAAAIFALTPVAASLFGKVLEDAALTCLLVLAAAAWQRSVQTGRLRSLVLCGVWVGLAFQAKMLQSWAVLPAFALAYLVAAPPAFLVRLRHVVVAGAVCLAVSLSWVIIATLTPAGDRPYVDGSTNNSAAAMVFGYNGLARFGSVGMSAAGTGSVSATQGVRFGGSTSGWLKLVENDLASQVGWLYPVAIAGILFGLWRRGRGRTDRVRGGTLMWTGWLVMTGLALSAGSVPHSTYVVALAPALAAVSAYALVRAVAAYRAPRRAGDRLILPALTAATLTWAVHLSTAFPHFLPGIALPLSAAAVTVVALALVAGRAPGRRSGMARWSAGLCCGLMLAVPAAWSVSVFDPAYAGSSGNANAGGYRGGMHFGLRAATPAHRAARPARLRFFNPFQPETSLDAAQSRLLAYLEENRDGARYLLATESWGTASPYILTTAAPVLPMGGFSGRADFPQPQQFQAMLRQGEVHYVLLTGIRGIHHLPEPHSPTTQTTRSAGKSAIITAPSRLSPVPVRQEPTAPAPGVHDDSDPARVAAAVAKTCTLVPGSAYGAVPNETAPLYRCD